jgi:uncharacterized protein (TIGR00369 family)
MTIRLCRVAPTLSASGETTVNHQPKTTVERPALPTQEELQERLNRGTGQIGQLNLKILDIDYEKQEIRVLAPLRPEFEGRQGTGAWHGGPIGSVIDTVGIFALAVAVGRAGPTINFRVDYLKPATFDLTVVARVRRAGRSVGISDIDVFDQAGSLVAIGRATYSTAPR